MSLLKQKKENDRVAAEAAAKAKEEAILRELAIHPVVKAGCSRDVRDAYFHGLVFAAIADDEKVDADELSILNGIAKSLILSVDDVADAIALVGKMTVEEKLQLIDECVFAIKDNETNVKLFYAQFAEIWMTGECDLCELKEYVDMFRGWSGVDFPTKRMKNVKAVISKSSDLNSSLAGLVSWMGDDYLRYFAFRRYGDVSSRIKQSQKARFAAEELAERRIAAKKALHVLQSEVAAKCGGWGSVHLGWIEKIKQRMSVVMVEQLDFNREVKDALKGYWAEYDERPTSWGICDHRRDFTFGNTRYVYVTYQWAPNFIRKKLGMVVVLLVCKYEVQSKAYNNWAAIDDMFKKTNKSNVIDNGSGLEEEFSQLVKQEFGV